LSLCRLKVWRVYWLYPVSMLRLPPSCSLAGPFISLKLLLLLLPMLGQNSVVHNDGWLAWVMLS